MGRRTKCIGIAHGASVERLFGSEPSPLDCDGHGPDPMSRPFRVPDGMTPPERSGDLVTSRLSIPLDADGFFGRECPNRDCLAYFKVHLDDYGLARSAHRLTCPACGTTQSDESFHTPRTDRADASRGDGAGAWGGRSDLPRSGPSAADPQLARCHHLPAVPSPSNGRPQAGHTSRSHCRHTSRNKPSGRSCAQMAGTGR